MPQTMDPVDQAKVWKFPTEFADSWQTWWRPERVHWREWGKQHLQTGDLVFTRGNYYLLFGAFNFSDVATSISEARFSHLGMVVIEDNIPMVYDISDEGVQATPFEAYVTRPSYDSVAVRRPSSDLYSHLPQCVAYLREQRSQNVRFDKHFSLSNDELYCTELIYRAFQQAGVELCEQTYVRDLPGLTTAPAASVFLAKTYTGLTDDSPLVCIGNESYGLYGSAKLQPLLSPTPIRSGSE